MSQELASAAEDRSARVPALDCCPVLLAPDPGGSSRRWWACRRRAPRSFFGLCPAGPHGHRPGHQTFAFVPLPWAWLQGGAPVTRVRARET